MNWDYDEAFSRNIGLITQEEQDKIKNTRVAIAGMGGVGGIHLVTLLRMGFTKFTIADFDKFELGNFNRQFGASMDTLDRDKAQVMRDIGLKINPQADIRVISEALSADNISSFLQDVTLYIDGLDVFEVEIRRKVFKLAREKGMWAITAGPIGFGTSWVVFDPAGMSFDEYFGMSDEMSDLEKFSAFLVGLSPKGLHRSYMDFKFVSFKYRKGTSNMLSCQLCAGVTGGETLKIILNRGCIKAAPYFHQFDAYKLKYSSGKVWGGGRAPWPRFKQSYLKKSLIKLDDARTKEAMCE